MKNNSSKKINYLMFKLIIALSLILITIIGFRSIEKNRNYVDISNNRQEYVFFYEDTCPDCRKIFPTILKEKILGHEIKLVNINGKKNRKYVSRYNLVKVPTLIQFKQSHEIKRFITPNKQQINEIFNKK